MAEKILVVEDDDLARRMLWQFLSEQGYQVEMASDGEAALELLQTHAFDLVLSDLLMPNGDGNQLLAQIRARSPRTRVILMSGNFTLAPVSLFYRHADGYVLKPIDLEKLLDKIRTTLTENSATL